MAFILRRVLSRHWLQAGSSLHFRERSLSGSGAHEPESLISSGIKKHLRALVQRHNSIVEKLSLENTGLRQEEQDRLFREVSSLEPLVKLVRELDQKHQEMEEYKMLMSDKELGDLARSDSEQCLKEACQLELALIDALVPQDKADNGGAILEVRSGAGGREASLFTTEMFQMYHRFSDFKGWKFEILSCDKSDDGGYKSASSSVTGRGAFGLLKFEGGVHRVQRVPATESLGRVHTSTMSVAVLAQPSEVDIKISPNDLKIETFRAGGAGGQHVNTTDSAVRMTHVPTGIVVKMQDERSQHQNRVKALNILRARVYDMKRKEKDNEITKERRQQIGTGERHERIRTYNYNQDRVTDHRAGITLYGIHEFLQGSDQLDELIKRLRNHQRTEYLTKLYSAD